MEAEFEVSDEDLERRILSNKAQISSRLNERAGYDRLSADLSGLIQQNSSAKYNSILTGNAKLSSEMLELESKLDVVSKDRDRLAGQLLGRTRRNVGFTSIPVGEVEVLRRELESLLSQNNALISQVQHAANVANNAAFV